MKTIKRFVLVVLLLGITLQVSAQETTKEPELNSQIENFELPTFSKLSNDIATEYTSVLESLPDLSNIGPYIDQELRRGFIDEYSISSNFRNFANENSLFQNIRTKKFELRHILNNIMFNGHDVYQLHMSDAYKATGN